MGYYSQVAACLRTEDFKDMIYIAMDEYEKDKKNFRYTVDLLLEGFYKSQSSHEHEDKMEALQNILKDVCATSEFVVLEWEWIKWYHSFSDVSWFINNIEKYKYYEIVEVGEDNCTTENRSEEGENYYNLSVEVNIRVEV